MSITDSSSSSLCPGSSVNCGVCGKDIGALELGARTAHAERCLDGTLQSPQPRSQSKTASSSKVEACLGTLELLDDCPVCGAAWAGPSNSRADHTRKCAKQHGMSDKDLYALVGMFRESLGSSTSTSDKDWSRREHSPPKSVAGEARASRAFLGAFCHSSAQAVSPQAGSRGKGKKRPAANKTTKDRLSTKPLDGWFERCSSAEPDCANDICETESQCSSSSEVLYAATTDDDDFQATKPRVVLTQTRIAVRRVNKRQQEFLDELDEELNEAKALSLSLQRGPDLPKRDKSAVRRREKSAKGTDVLAKSDILASAEAQSLIRQRAIALERIDEERQAVADLRRADKGRAVVGGGADQALVDGALRLWDMGALSEASGREYCAIFESYKECELLDHSCPDACLGGAVGRLLAACSLLEQNPPDSKAVGPDLLDEATVRRGYMRLLGAVHSSFSRHIAALRCSEWVDASETRDADKNGNYSADEGGSGDGSGVIVLSSESDPEAVPAAEQAAQESEAGRPAPPGAKKTSGGAKAPDYGRLAHTELQVLADKFGLRTNTPRRLLAHQLKTIWEQTNGPKPGSSTGAVSATPTGLAGEQAERMHQSLSDQLRRYIRSNNGLFEQILCYRVLDFDAVYRVISASVRCHRQALRKFFDAEGIVYSSYHD